MALTRALAPVICLSLSLTLTLTFTLTLPAPARAWHDREKPVTDYSAETLRQGEWRLYLGTLVEYGITDDWEIGTVPTLDAMTILNLSSKYTVWRDETFAIAVAAAFYTMTPQTFLDDVPDLRLWFFPLALHASWREPAGDYSAHLALQYANLSTAGEITASEALGVSGLVDGTTINLVPTFEWRRSRSFAWVFQATLSLAQAGQAQGDSTIESDDGRSRIEVFGEGNVRTGAFAYGNVSASAYWSWESCNLRLGLGYGNYELPGFGVLFDQTGVQPEFNLYWRF
jgi:hypothetical protein